MTDIDKNFIDKLLREASENPRRRQNYDLRTSADDGGQRMLNALLPGTVVPIHRHPHSNESVLLLRGRIDEVIYDERGREIGRHHLDPSAGSYGFVVPAGVWHSVDVLEPSVIFEAKDGRYGEDGSEILQAHSV